MNLLTENQPEYPIKFVSVDVGVLNFAYVAGCFTKTLDRRKIVTTISTCARIDLTTYDNCKGPLTGCTIPRHAKDAACRLRHMLASHPLLDADLLIIEQQPPMGMRDIEQSLIAIAEASGTRVKIVSPRAMHSYYNIGCLSYEKRKQWTTDRAKSALKTMDAFGDRMHDVADAYVMAEYVAAMTTRNQRTLHLRDLAQERLEHSLQIETHLGMPLKEFMHQFAYTKARLHPGHKGSYSTNASFNDYRHKTHVSEPGGSNSSSLRSDCKSVSDVRRLGFISSSSLSPESESES